MLQAKTRITLINSRAGRGASGKPVTLSGSRARRLLEAGRSDGLATVRQSKTLTPPTAARLPAPTRRALGTAGGNRRAWRPFASDARFCRDVEATRNLNRKVSGTWAGGRAGHQHYTLVPLKLDMGF